MSYKAEMMLPLWACGSKGAEMVEGHKAKVLLLEESWVMEESERKITNCRFSYMFRLQ